MKQLFKVTVATITTTNYSIIASSLEEAEAQAKSGLLYGKDEKQEKIILKSESLFTLENME